MPKVEYKKTLSKEQIENLHPDLKSFIKELSTIYGNDTFVVTSGYRKDSTTSSGNLSRHSKETGAEAIDIRPTEKLYDYLQNTKEGLMLLKKYKLGFLDERSKEAQKKYDSTGAHFHIGKDSTLESPDVRLEQIANGTIKAIPQEDVISQPTTGYLSPEKLKLKKMFEAGHDERERREQYIKDFPGQGDPYASLVGFNPNTTTMNTNDNPNIDTSIRKVDRALLDYVGKFESRNDYNILYSGYKGGSDKQLTEMTIQEVLDLQRKMAKESGSSAVGANQFVRGTLLEEIRKQNIPLDAIFTPELQDAMMVKRLRTYRGYDKFLEGKMTPEEFAFNLSQEFASLPDPNTNESHHKGVGNNKALTSVEDVLTTITQIREKKRIDPSQNEASVKSIDISPDTNPLISKWHMTTFLIQMKA